MHDVSADDGAAVAKIMQLFRDIPKGNTCTQSRSGFYLIRSTGNKLTRTDGYSLVRLFVAIFFFDTPVTEPKSTDAPDWLRCLEYTLPIEWTP